MQIIQLLFVYMKRVETSSGTFLGKTVVIAIGATPRTLGIPVEQALVGRGVAVHMAEELYLEKRFKNLLTRGIYSELTYQAIQTMFSNEKPQIYRK